MSQPIAPPTGLRSITRNVVRAQISNAAIDLFLEHGFESVTIEQVAAAVGISSRSVHRYFPAKEDMVIGEPERYGEFVREALSNRPAAEPAWVALRKAYEALLSQGEHNTRGKAAMQLLGSTATLRARNLEKHLMWSNLLVPLIAERLGGTDSTLRAQALVQSSLACFDTALTAWAEPTETRDPATLLKLVFDEIAPSK